jgi:putative tricarboxylic transport membrane protein
MSLLTKDRALALAVLILAAVLAVESLEIPARTRWQPYGSAFFPQILLGALATLGALLLARTFLPGAPREAPLLPDIAEFAREHPRILALLLLFGLYAWALPILGFIYATGSFLLAAFVLLGAPSSRKRALIAAAVAVAVTLAVYATFRYGLRIRLP